MDSIVELCDVSFGYGATPILQNVTMALARGQFAAIVGPSGAGKTSLLKLVLGTQQATHGTVALGDRAAGHPTPRVSYVPQVDAIDWNFPVTVEQVVMLGRVQRSWPWPWPSRDDKRKAREVMTRLQIDQLAGQHIRNLSGGQQQRVFLARALIAEPDLLVLDEPTSGVDMQTAEKMLHLLLDLNSQGMTILMTTHDLNMAAAHIPWIVCLNGRVVAQGAPDAIFTPDILSETYRGEMMVIRHDGVLLVHQKPHSHRLADVAMDAASDYLASGRSDDNGRGPDSGAPQAEWLADKATAPESEQPVEGQDGRLARAVSV